MATTITRYTNPHSSGGDGTTNALSGATAAYVSVDACYDAEVLAREDLVSRDEILDIVCETAGNADTSPVLIANFITDATRYVQIRAGAGHRHDGKWNTAKARLVVADVIPLEVRIAYFKLIGMQLEVINPTQALTVFASQNANASELLIDGCLVRTHTDAGFACSVFDTNQTHASGVLKVRNCVLVDRTNNSSSRGISDQTTTGHFHNNTIVSRAGTVVRVFLGTTNLKNCALVTETGGTLAATGGTFAPTNCISTDALADDFGGSGNQVNVTEASMLFTGAASTDYHIGAGSSLENQGTSLAADANLPVTDDIDGQPRTGTYDVGADSIEGGGLSVNIGEAVIGGSLF